MAQRTGSYTAFDYADIVQYLNERWTIKDRSFKSGEAAAAQEYVLKVPDRIRKLAERANGEGEHVHARTSATSCMALGLCLGLWWRGGGEGGRGWRGEGRGGRGGGPLQVVQAVC